MVESTFSLASVFNEGSVPAASKAKARHALSYPWCWPKGSPTCATLGGESFSRPGSPGVGEVLVLAETGGQGSLWKVGPSSTSLALGSEAADALRLARRIVPAVVAIAPRLADLRKATHWKAECIANQASSPPSLLNGPSCGLSVLLAAASVGLGLSVPMTLAATAGLAPGGRLCPVAESSLKAKIQVLCDWGLGVDTLLVHADQFETAKSIVESIVGNRALKVHGVERVSEALPLAFPNAVDTIREHWKSNPGEVERAADDLFVLMVRGSDLIDYGAIRATAELLQEQLQGRSAQRMALASKIAHRRMGGVHDVLIPWPEPCELQAFPGRLLRVQYLANVVQSALDANDDVEAIVAKAKPFVGDVQDRVELELRGAIGRALGATRAYEKAVPWLEETVKLWHVGLMPDGAPRPLCELLRVLGVRKSVTDIERLVQTYVPSPGAEPSADDSSSGYLRQAVGRAFLLAERWTDALAYLGDEDGFKWDEMPEAVPLRRQRDLARALDGSQRQSEADALPIRNEKCDGPHGVYYLLAKLDQALRKKEQVDANNLLHQIKSYTPKPQAIRWVEGLKPQDFAREYPY